MSKKLLRNTGLLLVISIAVFIIILYFNQIQAQLSSFLGEFVSAFSSIETAREYIASFGIFAPLISALLMIFQSVIAPLPAYLITIANGALFGFWLGLLLSWGSAMLGAALCFLIARVFGSKHVAKIITQPVVDKTDDFIKKYGNYAILIARLLPFVPFDVVSYGAGLTRMQFIGFWIATGIGQLPATAVYTYLGNRISTHTRLMLYGFGIAITVSLVIWLLKTQKSKN